MATSQDRFNAIVDAIVETVEESGPMGAPGGHLYAALMSTGMSLEVFERIMSALVGAGKLRKSGDCYHATVKNPDYVMGPDGTRRSAGVRS